MRGDISIVNPNTVTLSVHLSKDYVQRAQDHHGVGHIGALNQLSQGHQIAERGGSNLQTIGHRPTLAHHIHAEVAPRALRSYVYFASGWSKHARHGTEYRPLRHLVKGL